MMALEMQQDTIRRALEYENEDIIDLFIESMDISDAMRATPLSDEGAACLTDGLKQDEGFYFKVNTTYEVELVSLAHCVMLCEERNLRVDGMKTMKAINILNGAGIEKGRYKR